jgi:ethanolamine permease
VAFMVAGYIYFLMTKNQRANAPRDAMLAGE